MTALQDVVLVTHLCAWAQLGTLVRIYLGKLFGGSCQLGGGGPWYWIPCVTSPGSRYGGALFQDLPANVAGSFVMGLLSTSDTLAAVFRNPSVQGSPVAFLPPGIALQSHTPLAIGLRTGFCGSLTTFSSWILQMTEMTVGGPPAELGSEWVAALWGYVIGTSVALTALYMGQQAALALHLAHARRAAARAERTPAPEAEAVADSDSARQLDATARCAVKDGQEAQRSPTAAPASPAQATPGDVLVAPDQADAPHLSVVLSPHSPTPPPTIAVTAPLPPAAWPCVVADFCASSVLLTLTAISISYSITESSGPHETGRRYFWFSLLFGPFGCLLRWQLSKLNGALPGALAWFPAGTFSANMLAVLLDCALQAVIVRVSLTALELSVLSGIIIGVGGCLSTVSTWVVEIQKLELGYPGHTRAHMYAVLSLLTALLLGLLVYGTAVWTM